MRFYLGLMLQLFGFTSVGICFFMGIKNGDYGKLELFQFVGGTGVFYLGHFIRLKG